MGMLDGAGALAVGGAGVESSGGDRARLALGTPGDTAGEEALGDCGGGRRRTITAVAATATATAKPSTIGTRARRCCFESKVEAVWVSALARSSTVSTAGIEPAAGAEVSSLRTRSAPPA